MRRSLPLLLTLALLWSPAGTASADWIWIPRLGQWLNPKRAPKETPSLQYAYAMHFWEEQHYERARGEFRKLINTYPLATEAPDAQYYIGRSAEELGDFYNAFEAYRRVIQVYPASTRTEEILEREYRIANLFFQGEKREVLGYKMLPGVDAAIEVYTAIIEDAPFSEHGPLALYKLGMCHKIIGEFQIAMDTFQRLIEEHPQHALLDDAKFQIADCSAKISRASTYDQSYTDDAMKDFRRFVQEHPESHLVPEAEERVLELVDKRAQHDYEVAEFYQGRKSYASARVYYESILRRYPQSAWATKAANQLDVINAREHRTQGTQQ